MRIEARTETTEHEIRGGGGGVGTRTETKINEKWDKILEQNKDE